ncbi:hypothetical protein [Kocuria tytonis]|uniref:Uncharacterized protein n=1 Tax=Kocuria tytonis TaxID=2054280 RepID=A0A495A8Y7_9MICC|nr:hypothetical protein [Kocuria tytonis]RKQ36509.1 hypothetical protein C1C97_002285 [Kocuria tytonis]
MTMPDVTGTERYEDPWSGVPVIGAGAVEEVPERAWPPAAGSGTDGVSVHCSASGEPLEVVHRGCRHRVLQPVIHWYERRNWWDVADRVPRESEISAVDRECWRMQAVEPGALMARTFDLTRDQFTGRWRVLRAGF